MATEPSEAPLTFPNRPRPQTGFTLVELIVVVVIGAVVATTLALFMRPVLSSYVDTRVRGDLTDQADTAVHRMLQDVRNAVPNSLRLPNTTCFEMVPASAGGRYRMGPDTSNDTGTCPSDSTCAKYVDTTTETSTFDSLSTLVKTPAVGDWVVIDNQNVNDVYAGSNRAAITAVSTPAASQGKHRITINPLQVSTGYDGGRFLVVPDNQQAVFYICSGAGVDASGQQGTGTLYRKKRYGFDAAYPSACPSTTGADVIATRISSCRFRYDPNHGATQQSGFMWLELALTRNGERVQLTVGAHVMNVP